MPLSAGQTLPDVPLAAITKDGPEERSRDKIFGGKKVLLFAVVGAFTGTCNDNHLPGYISHAAQFKAKGIDEIAVLAVNDVHVMGKWKELADPSDAVLFLSDGSTAFTKAVDMVLDGTNFGLGVRSLRYAALINDGVVEGIAVEDNPGVAQSSTAEAMLAMLDDA